MGSQLGDFIRAVALLRVTDPEQARQIAGMLGLQLKPATATPTTDATTGGKDKESEPATTPTK